MQADPIPARAKTNSTGSPPLVCSATGRTLISSNAVCGPRHVLDATYESVTFLSDLRQAAKADEESMRSAPPHYA
jgi:hypothetical protein